MAITNAPNDTKRRYVKRATDNRPIEYRDLVTGEIVSVSPEDVDDMNLNEIDAMITLIRKRDGGRGGTPARYRNITELQDAIAGYWETVSEARKRGMDIYPDVEGVCSYLGVSRDTFLRWRREDYQGYGETIDILFTNIAAVKKQLAMHGTIPALVFTVDMNNNHGYVQQSKVDIQQTSKSVIPDTATLLQQISELPTSDD